MALIICTVLITTGALMDLIGELTNHAIAGASISVGIALLGAILFLLAGVLLTIAFFGERERRASRLTLAAMLVGGYYLSQFGAIGLLAGIFIGHQAPGAISAAFIAIAVGEAVGAAALFVVAGAFSDPQQTSAHAKFGAAFVTVAVAAVILVTAAIIGLSSSSPAASALSTGSFGVNLASFFVEGAAAVVMAVALFGTAQRLRRGDVRALQLRDRLLSGGLSGLAVAVLLAGIAQMVAAGHDANEPSILRVGDWVAAVGYVLLVIPYGLWCTAHAINGWRRSATPGSLSGA